MEYFLESFGDVKIGTAVVLICALVFLLKCYRKVENYFSQKAIEEKENNDRINEVLKQAEKYPEWHKQSVQIREGINSSIERLDRKIDKLQNSNDEGMALTWRYRILRFNDEIRNDIKHTKEHFDQILEDITNYENYCREHKNFKNDKATFAVSNIRNVYQKCMDENSFL